MQIRAGLKKSYFTKMLGKIVSTKNNSRVISNSWTHYAEKNENHMHIVTNLCNFDKAKIFKKIIFIFYLDSRGPLNCTSFLLLGFSTLSF